LVQQAYQRSRSARARATVGKPIECPTAFLDAAQQTRLAHDLEVATHARLALLKDSSQFADRQFSARNEGKDAQPGRLRSAA
jgi:hypothetical protein